MQSGVAITSLPKKSVTKLWRPRECRLKKLIDSLPALSVHVVAADITTPWPDSNRASPSCLRHQGLVRSPQLLGPRNNVAPQCDPFARQAHSKFSTHRRVLLILPRAPA